MIKEELTRHHNKVLEEGLDSYDFEPIELSYLVYGGKQNYETLSRMERICAIPPLAHNLDRAEAFRINLERSRVIKEKIVKYDLPKIDYMNSQTYGNVQGGFFPTSMSHCMFSALVRILGNEEQKQKWLQDIIDEKIIGCYAQTEIGHGSDIKSLETQVVYDPTTEEFVVNTPTVTAIKFWPGDLGVMSNHVVFHGHLISQGKDHGVHAFFCRIRDQDSHIPLKGVEVGDIGPKHGYIQKDNGYLSFKDFRIPREALLAQFTTISSEGEVSSIGDPKVAYSVMLQIR